MTLHVALVGTDGIVLAGDKQVMTTDEYVTTAFCSKIKLDRAKGIAIAWAHDDSAETIADEILERSEVLEDKPALRKLIKRIYRKRMDEG